jgi:hypothetical protein
VRVFRVAARRGCEPGVNIYVNLPRPRGLMACG